MSTLSVDNTASDTLQSHMSTLSVDLTLVQDFFSSILPNPNIKNALLRFLGYCLTGETKEQKSAIIYGNGANGKSVLTSVLQYVFGDFSRIIPESALQKLKYQSIGRATTEINNLIGKRLALIEELSPGFILDTTKFKLMTGCNTINIRKIYQEETTFQPLFKLIIVGNNTPEFSDSNDNSMARRLILIPFEQDFSINGDTFLTSKLIKASSALLTLLVYEAMQYYKEGLLFPEELHKATREYLDNLDFINEFIHSCCEIGESYSTPRKLMLKLLREKYALQCRNLTDKTLITMLLNSKLIQLKMINHTSYFIGIKITEEVEY